MITVQHIVEFNQWVRKRFIRSGCMNLSVIIEDTILQDSILSLVVCYFVNLKKLFLCLFCVCGVIGQTAWGKDAGQLKNVTVRLNASATYSKKALEKKDRWDDCHRFQSCFDAGILFFIVFDWQICQHCHFSLTVSLLCSLTEISFDYLPLSFRFTELLESLNVKTAHFILHPAYKCNCFNVVGFLHSYPSLQWCCD